MRHHSGFLLAVVAALALWSQSAATATPTQTCTPGQDPAPGCSYEGPSPPQTPTPPDPTPRPERTGDIGFVEVTGHVYRLRDGLRAPVDGALVRVNGRETTTDADGRFRLSIFVHDTDTFSFRAEFEGTASGVLLYSGIDLAFRRPVIELLIAPSGSVTATMIPPTTTPTPWPGDLGIKSVSGTIFDAATGPAALISDATLSYQHNTTIGTGGSGEVGAPAGAYLFELFLRDTDTITIEAVADGYRPATRRIGGYALWVLPNLSIGLTQQGICPGDCDRNGQVSVFELVRAVGIALGTITPGACRIVDTDGDSRVSIAELTQAAQFGLLGCS